MPKPPATNPYSIDDPKSDRLLVRFIEAEEGQRGQIARTDRSVLSEPAEPCQVILDKLILALLGLGADRHEYIEARLEQML